MPEYLDTWSRKRSTGTISPSQRARLMALASIQSLIGGRDAATLAKYPDTSHWNGKLNLAAMRPWVSAIMAKCSDGKQVIAGSVVDPNTYVDDMFADTVQQAYDVGMPVIAYPYWQPDLIPAANKANDRQYSALMYALKNKKPGASFHEIRVDLEEKSVYGHVQVKSHLQTFWSWLVEDFGGVVPLSVYSSDGYLNSVPAVRDWIILQKIPVHYAQWVYNTKTRLTWAQAHAKVNTWNVKVLNFAGWLACQLTSSFYGMEGCGDGEIDYNVHNGTEADLYKWLNYKQVITPPPPPPPPVEPPPSNDLTNRVKALEDQVTALRGMISGLTAEYSQHTHGKPEA